jgi:hypothetical protein
MAGGLAQDTASFAFDGSNDIAATEQVAKLSETEMKETKGRAIITGTGALLTAAGSGAVGGVGAYAYDTYIHDRSFSYSAAGAHAMAGAVAGAMAGPWAGTASNYAVTAAHAFGVGAAVNYVHDHWPW